MRGEVRFDDGGKASGEIVVDATKTETGSDGRDQDMHAKVLESAKYEEIVLAVDGFEGKFDPAAPSNGQGEGPFHASTASSTRSRSRWRSTPQGAAGAEQRLDATTTFTVPYVEWGMKDPSKAFLRVGKVVDVIDRRERVAERWQSPASPPPRRRQQLPARGP